jgi:hypothetical protein
VSYHIPYINNLTNLTNNDSKIILYADNTSILITNSSKSKFNTAVNENFRNINEWFYDNVLSLNYNKTQYLEFK